MPKQDHPPNGLRVVSLPAPPDKHAPVPQVIAELESWLTLAKRGELTGVVVAGTTLDHSDDVAGVRFGASGRINAMEIASLCEQHAYNTRAEVYEMMSDVDYAETDPEPGHEPPETDND